ncbi:LAGLIDADG family homing endonuclease [Halegenticoccus tardaugens]|uniref:LAGLIDADG family homing endonuclease n=1 Tax=Halegenticoccus tardaugens TaxID=2071624 RepID=UPI00100A7CB5|nr:LAGLIDADG family homing endonuclease [Halegenticoccus tardaugens]
MAQAQNQELTERFIQFYRNYYREAIGQLAQKYPNEQRSLYVDYDDLYTFDPDLAEDYLSQPEQLQEYAEEALRLYDLPADVSLGQAHVRLQNIPESIDIRGIRVHDNHVGKLVSVQGIVRKATDVRPKITEAAFECQRCGTMTYIPQAEGGFQEPHECQGCERQGPFRVNFDQSEFIDSQKLRIQESPEGLRGGETPQSIDVNIEDDITGRVTAGDHVSVTGVLHIEQMQNGQEKSAIFDLYMDGISIVIEDEEFEDMDITDEDKREIVELSNDPDIYEEMVASVAPSIYGYDEQKLAMILQLFSGVTKHLPDGSRIRGDLHMLLIGDPGTGKSQLLSYIQNIAPRSVYTSGKGSSSAGLTAAAVRDDFGDGQQWSLEAGALVLADKGIAAVDELDKMRCVTGDTLVHLGDGRVTRIAELAHEAGEDGEIETLSNGRTIRDVGVDAWTMTDDDRLVTRPIAAIHEYDAPDELTRVTLESGEKLTAVDDHPFFVLDDGERVEKPAEALDPDDWVYVPRHLPRPTGDGGVTAAEQPTAPSADDGSRTEDGSGPDDPPPAFGAVLGYLSGDGNVYYDRDEGVYGIRFTNTEEELLSDFEDACRAAFGTTPIRHPSERRDDGVETVRLSGREYAESVLDAGMCLGAYDERAFPTAVSDASPSTKAAFVRAVADSEGCVDAATGNVKISSSSYELLLGVKSLLLEFGVTCQIRHREHPEKRDLYALAITAADSLRRFNRHVGFTLARKQSLLDEVCASASGDGTILDVIPNCGERLRSLRDSLRLYVSECGLVDATYCNFENGDANASISRARTILDAFEARKAAAREDAATLSDSCDWRTLTRLKERYHVSQSELADGTAFSQQQISNDWGEDDDLQAVVTGRLGEIVESVAETDLSTFRELVRGDVMWRRVKTVETVAADRVDDRIRLLRNELADVVGGDATNCAERARALLAAEPTVDDWSELRRELDRYGVSFADVATDLGVDGSTVSRWFDGVVRTDRFDEVVDVALARIADVREEIRRLLDAIESRSEPKVYDMTVEGTHNFVANGMVVHNSEDRSAMHEGLEQQQISISKAGINATLKSRCSLLGAANPKYGRFDQYESIGEQIDLEPALISRFDLIFTVTDQPDPEHDSRLAEHILRTNYAGELHTQRTRMPRSNFTAEEVEEVTETVAPSIDPDLLRKYIAYAKRNVFPTMTPEAREAIRDFYVNLRSKGADEDAPVPVTARKLEALVRLSEASARVRLSDTVEPEDADRVIEIVRSCLQDIGVDPETGQFDADVVETGRSKTQRDRIKNLKQLIADIEGEYEEGAPVEEVLERAGEIGLDRSKAEGEIEKLRRKGEVYEPRQNHLRTT